MSMLKQFKPQGKKIGGLSLDTKLTDRDKKLLIVLAVVVVITLSYYVLYNPLSAKLSEVKAERLVMDQRVAQAKDDLANEQMIIQQYNTELQNGIEASSAFFPKVYPYSDRYVLLMNRLLRGNGVTVTGIRFSDPVVGAVSIPSKNSFSIPNYPLGNNAYEINQAYPEMQEAIDSANAMGSIAPEAAQSDSATTSDAVIRLAVSVDFEGSYGQYRAVISSLEKLNRAIALESVNVTKKEAVVTVKMELVFYIVDKIDNGTDDFNAWTITGTYGKSDPFN